MEARFVNSSSYTYGRTVIDHSNLNKFIAKLFDRLRNKYVDEKRLIMTDTDFSRIFRRTDMKHCGNRLQTFIVGKWDKLVSMSELSTAGFCFTGNEDKVVCFSCKGVLMSWEAGDLPLTRHVRAFGHCKFAKTLFQKYKPKSKLAFDNARVTAPPVYNDERLLEGEFDTISFFNSEYNRLLSLIMGLSIEHNVNVKELAKAGFFHDRDSSHTVKCFVCCVKIQGSQGGDEPMKVHKQKSPKCPFVNNLCPRNKPITDDELRQSSELFERYAETSSLAIPFKCTESPLETMEHRNAKERTLTSFNDDQMYLTAKYKEYFTEIDRVKSFSNWPEDHFLRPAVFAKAGFFKSGREDQVTCFYCGLNLLDWEPEDDPLVEHKREAPECKFLAFQISKCRVKKTILQEQRITGNVSLQEATELERKDCSQTSQENKVSTVTDLEGLIDSEITKDIISMGFSEEMIKRVYQQRLESEGQQTPFKDAGDLLQAIFEEEDKGKQEKIKHQDSVKGPVQNSAPDRESMNALEQKIERLEERNTCKICLDEEVSVIFLPCKHLTVCDGCAERVETCPICREVIEDKLQVYIP